MLVTWAEKLNTGKTTATKLRGKSIRFELSVKRRALERSSVRCGAPMVTGFTLENIGAAPG